MLMSRVAPFGVLLLYLFLKFKFIGVTLVNMTYYCILKVILGELVRLRLGQGSLIHEGDLESYLPRACVYMKRDESERRGLVSHGNRKQASLRIILWLCFFSHCQWRENLGEWTSAF